MRGKRPDKTRTRTRKFHTGGLVETRASLNLHVELNVTLNAAFSSHRSQTAPGWSLRDDTAIQIQPQRFSSHANH